MHKATIDNKSLICRHQLKLPLMEHIVIIGNGVAGVTAARHIRKMSDKRITIISAESEFFFSRTALMYVIWGI